MAILTSKWTLTIVGILLVFLLLAVTGRKRVHTELVIKASPQAVWSVLTNAAEYVKWNPVIVPVKGQFQAGSRLQYRMTGQNGKISQLKAVVRKVIPLKEINQFGGMPLIMTFSHTWRLVPVQGGTRVIQHEEYRGIGVHFWNPEWFQTAYSNANHALSERIRQLGKKL